MATSGDFTGSIWEGRFTFKSYWTEIQNISNNTTTITMTHKVIVGQYCSISIGTRNNTATVGGVTKSFTSPAISGGAGTYDLGTTTHVITHNSDGTIGDLSYSGKFSIQATLGGTYYSQITNSGTISLPTIPRASSFAINSGTHYFGSSVGISISRASTSFTHKVTYKVGSSSYTLTGQTTSSSYTIPVSWLTQIPSSSQATLIITMQTYSGSTAIGSPVTHSTTLYITSSTANPSCSVAITRIDGDVPSSWGVWVAGYSKASLTLTSSTQYNAAVVSRNISCGGYTSSGTSLITGYLTGASFAYKGTVKDSRNKSASTSTTTVTLQDYQKPRLTANCYRVNEDNEADTQGDRIAVNLTLAISSVANHNSVEILRYRYKKTTQSDVDYSTPTNVSNEGTAYFTADTDSSYDVQVYYKDGITDGYTYYEVASTYSIIDIKANGKGVAFGKSAETDNLLDVEMNMNISGDLEVNNTITTGGNLIVDGGIRTHYVTSANDLNNTSFVSFGTDISLGGITIPQSSKGTLTLVEGTYNSLIHDAVLNVTSSSGVTYTAFRNGSTWTHGKGTTGKLLWQGSHNVGDTFTIPEFSSYSTFAIHLDGAGAEIIVTKGVGSYLSGGAAYGYSNSRYIYVFASKINSGGSITIYDSNITSFSNMSSSTELSVKYIYGLF